MTDLANVSALTRTPVQLPIDWYFDPRIAEIERKLLFDRGPGYVGHELMVPEVGDYRSLDWMHHAKVLVRNQSGVELLSNVCRHRQSIMLKGRGHAQNIVCPLHRWTYDMSGKLLGAPAGMACSSWARAIRIATWPALACSPTWTFPVTCSTG